MMATAFDIIGLLLIGVLAMSGLKKGLIDGVFKMVGVYAAVYASMNYHHYGTALLHPLISIPESYQTAAGFVVVFVLVMYSFTFASWLLRKLVKTLHLGIFDRLGGITFGAMKAGLILSAVVWAFAMVPSNLRGDWQEESKLYPLVEVFAGEMVNVLSLEDELLMLQETVGSLMGQGQDQLLQSALQKGGLGNTGLTMDAITKVGAGGTLSADGQSIVPSAGDLMRGGTMDLSKNEALQKAMESLEGPQKEIIEKALEALQSGNANSLLQGAIQSKDEQGNSLMDAAMEYMDPAQKANLHGMIKEMEDDIKAQQVQYK